MKVKISVTKLARLLDMKKERDDLISDMQDAVNRVRVIRHNYDAEIENLHQKLTETQTENATLRRLADKNNSPLADAIASMVLTLASVDTGTVTYRDIVQDVTNDRKVRAIKTLRMAYPALGLRECKNVIDSITHKLAASDTLPTI